MRLGDEDESVTALLQLKHVLHTLVIDPICIEVGHCRLIQSIVVVLLDLMDG